jgi:hypothetical protein
MLPKCSGQYFCLCTFFHCVQNLRNIYPARDEACVSTFTPCCLYFFFVRDLIHLQLRLCWHDWLLLRVVWPSCDRPAGRAWWVFVGIHTGTGIPPNGGDILCSLFHCIVWRGGAPPPSLSYFGPPHVRHRCAACQELEVQDFHLLLGRKTLNFL